MNSVIENAGESLRAGARCFPSQGGMRGAPQDMTHLVALGEWVQVCRRGGISRCCCDVTADWIRCFPGCPVRIDCGGPLQLGTGFAVDEPSGGLHRGDDPWIVRLVEQLNRLVDRCNSEAGDLSELVHAQLEVQPGIDDHDVSFARPLTPDTTELLTRPDEGEISRLSHAADGLL